MVSNSSNLHSFLQTPITHPLFSHMEPKENVHTMSLVCKGWQVSAIFTVKMQLIKQEKERLSTIMAPFLILTGKEVRDYCPRLKELKKSINAINPAALLRELGVLTEKHTLHILHCNILGQEPFEESLRRIAQYQNGPQIQNPQALSLVENVFLRMILDSSTHVKAGIERKKYICEKAFLVFSHSREPNTVQLFNPDDISHFPIELFNLRIEGENNALTGERNSGNYCFYQKGRLIEVTLIPKPSPPPSEQAIIIQSPDPFYLHFPASWFVPHLDGAPTEKQSK